MANLRSIAVGEILQTKNVPQLISSHIRGGQPVADCTLISSVDLFFFFLENTLVSVGKVKILENFF